MLKEDVCASETGTGKRRWFSSERFGLIVWMSEYALLDGSARPARRYAETVSSGVGLPRDLR